jgi:hypothetical protein
MTVDEVCPSTVPPIDPIGDDDVNEDVDNSIPQAPVMERDNPHHLVQYLHVLEELTPNDEERLEHLVTASISDVAFSLMYHQAIEAREGLFVSNVACPADSQPIQGSFLRASRILDSSGHRISTRGARESRLEVCRRGFWPDRYPHGR